MVIKRILVIYFILYSLNSFAADIVPNAAVVAKDNAVTSLVNKVKSALSSTVSELGKASQTAPSAGNQATEEKKEVGISIDKCEVARKATYAACAEWLQTDIIKFIQDNNDMIQMGMMIGSSLGEQCKGITKTLNTASTVLGAFTAGCKVAQSSCKSACNVAKTKNSKFKATAGRAAQESAKTAQVAATTNDTATVQQATNDQNTFTKKANEATKEDEAAQKAADFCGSFEVTTQSAMLGAMNALKGAVQAKKCEEQNSNNIAAVDCTTTTSAGYSTLNCQCVRGEKTAAECQNININVNNIKPGSINAPNISGSEAGSAATTGLGDGGSGDSEISAASTGGLSGPGAPVEGGGGGASGASVGSGNAQDGAYAAKRLNTNILGGGFGGGGGGGGSGSGPGYGMDEKLKDYMPGAKNDPSRSLASQLAKEVTPPAGRSNWEKVKLRYRDNTNTLLNKK